MEWNLWNTGKVADPKSPVGGSYAFSKPKPQSVEISNSSFVLQFASRRFLDQLLGGEDNARANRQLKDAEFGNKDIGNYNLQIWLGNHILIYLVKQSTQSKCKVIYLFK